MKNQDARFKEITHLQNRLDEAEAELAAIVAIGKKRGLDFVRSHGLHLLDEIDSLSARLRRLILE